MYILILKALIYDFIISYDLDVLRGILTLLLHIEEALHGPLSWSFKVLLCRPYPSHQILNFLSCALEIISCLQRDNQNNRLLGHH